MLKRLKDYLFGYDEVELFTVTGVGKTNTVTIEGGTDALDNSPLVMIEAPLFQTGDIFQKREHIKGKLEFLYNRTWRDVLFDIWLNNRGINND